MPESDQNIAEMRAELDRLRARLSELESARPCLWWLAESAGEWSSASEAWREIAGVPRQQLLGKGWQEHIHPKDLPGLLQRIEEAWRERRCYLAEYRLYRAKGGYARIIEQGVPRLCATGTFRGMKGTCLNLTGQAAHWESDDGYSRLFAVSPVPCWIYEAATQRVLAANAIACQVYGYSQEEFCGLTMADLRAPEELTGREDPSDVQPTGFRRSGPWMHRAKGGGLRIVEENTHQIRYQGLPACLVLLHDITETYRVSEALRVSEERYREIFDNANDLIYSHSLTGKIFSANAAISRILGFSREEVLGMNIFDLIDAGYAHVAHSMIAAKLGGEGQTTYELALRARDGSRRWLDVSTRLLFRNGIPAEVQGVGRDITERKANEQLIAEQGRFIERVAETAPTVIYLYDALRGRFDYVNRAVTPVLGYQPDEFLKLAIPDLFPDRSPEPGLSLVRAARDGEIVEGELTISRADGTTRILESRAVVFSRDAEGNCRQVLGIAQDVTLRVEVQRQLARFAEELQNRNEELASALSAAQESTRLKGQFLANMSHEIRTPMNGVIGMTNLLLDTPLNPEQREYAVTVRESAEALLSVIDQILDYSRIDAQRLTLEFREFDLRKTVRALHTLFRERAQRKRIDLEMRVSDNVPAVLLGDDIRIRQILINLLGNAIKFTESGHVRLSVDCAALSHDKAAIVFEVRDTGIGIERDAVGRIFQPFVQADGSTTRKYGGTGLGLAITQQLVDLMGGMIEVESELGAGSAFRVHLPLSVPGAPSAG